MLGNSFPQIQRWESQPKPDHSFPPELVSMDSLLVSLLLWHLHRQHGNQVATGGAFGRFSGNPANFLLSLAVAQNTVRSVEELHPNALFPLQRSHLHNRRGANFVVLI